MAEVIWPRTRPFSIVARSSLLTGARAAIRASFRSPRRQSTPADARDRTISRAGTSTGNGPRPLPSRRKCATSSDRLISSRTIICRPTFGCRRRCCKPMLAARWRPTLSPATSGTIFRPGPTNKCLRSETSPSTIRLPVSRRLLPCPRAGAGIPVVPVGQGFLTGPRGGPIVN